MRNVAKYQVAKARASEQGLNLLIVNDDDDAASNSNFEYSF